MISYDDILLPFSRTGLIIGTSMRYFHFYFFVKIGVSG